MSGKIREIENRHFFYKFCIFIQFFASFSFCFYYYSSQPSEMGLGKIQETTNHLSQAWWVGFWLAFLILGCGILINSLSHHLDAIFFYGFRSPPRQNSDRSISIGAEKAKLQDWNFNPLKSVGMNIQYVEYPRTENSSKISKCSKISLK